MQINAAQVDCPTKDDGLVCVKLSAGKFELVAQVDMTSGEGTILGQPDSQFYLDASDKDGVMVNIHF